MTTVPIPTRCSRTSRRRRRARRAPGSRSSSALAPGVGKTYAMLEAARRATGARASTWSSGVVETHGRAETAALLDGLECCRARSIEHRGVKLEELDLDAALARKPELILVDELAHTNAPGSRHAKRWQDVLELLDAGIDVYTTLNVQHVESLNDVVAADHRRQGARDRARLRCSSAPTRSSSSTSLPRSCSSGCARARSTSPSRRARAAEHFFQRGNLLALRELALRRTARARRRRRARVPPRARDRCDRGRRASGSSSASARARAPSG